MSVNDVLLAEKKKTTSRLLKKWKAPDRNTGLSYIIIWRLTTGYLGSPESTVRRRYLPKAVSGKQLR
jgi:hypothetical protein